MPIEKTSSQSFHLLPRDTTPQFLLPTQLATIVQELAAGEFRKVDKLTSAIPSEFGAI